MVDLTGKVVLITGATSGIGRDCAIQSAKQGAKLILTSRRKSELEKVKLICDGFGYETAVIYPLDVSDATQIDCLITYVQTLDLKVDILLNAAGFGDFSALVEIDSMTINNMFKVNVLGLIYLTRLVAQEMIKEHNGHILNIGSMAGKIPTPKSTIYSATKAAVIAFSDSLRLELKPFGIKVTTVNPGPVKTNFFNIADHSGQYLKNVDFIVLDSEQLACEIVNAFTRNVREINRPRVMNLAGVAYKVFPHIGDMLVQYMGNFK